MTEAEALGASASARFHPGFPEDCPVLTDSRNVQWDVVFSGTVTHQHTRRIAILDMIAQLSADPAGGFSFGLFMPDVSALPPHVQDEEELRAMMKTRLVSKWELCENSSWSLLSGPPTPQFQFTSSA